jgi:hypothetical protein
MPPPRRAKIETSEAPSASVVSAVTTVRSPAQPHAHQYQKNPAIASRARPATSMPVIAPGAERQGQALLQPLCAAAAVRTLARTDTFMPMKPATPKAPRR